MADQPRGNSQTIVPRALDPQYAGAQREITVSADGTGLAVHDGVTPGGHGVGLGLSGTPNSGVASFNGRVGIIALTAADITAVGGLTGSALADALTAYTTTATLNTALALKAPLASPTFTGVPAVPTATAGTQTTQAASTAFVMSAINTIVTGTGNGGVAGVASFNGRTGVTVLTAADVTGVGGALLASPAFTGTPTVPTASAGTNTTQAASTAFVNTAIAAVNAGTPGVVSFNTRAGAVTLNTADIVAAGGAPLDSAAFTGTPTVPTATAGTNTTQAASTAFVTTAVAGKANSASPTFTGTPLVPTAAPGTATTQAASTAFVAAAMATVSNGVSTFNTRSGAITLTGSDITAAGGALLVSPAFTGNPTVPTAAAGDSTSSAASTAFVQSAVAAIIAQGVSGVGTFNGRTGTVTLQAADVTGVGGALLVSPTFTGTPLVPTATAGTNTTQAASTAFVTAACAAVAAGAAGVTSFNTRTGAITLTAADVTGVGGALLASPSFTGTPLVPTAAAGTNTTQAASTAFVTAAVAAASVGGGGGTAGVASFNGRAGAVTLGTADITAAGGALLASPTFTGTPIVPTAAAGTNTTQAASTAFVNTAIAGFAPLASPSFTGTPLVPTAAVGTNTTQAASTAYALAAATAAAAPKANSASPTFTGVPAAPTAAVGTSTTQLATTAFAATAATNAATSAAASKAPLASPALTGTPTAPTPTAGDSSTLIATTAFVTGAINTLQAWVTSQLSSVPPTSPKASADGTTIPSAASITDANLDVWTISSTATILKNGVAAGTTSNVTLLLYFGSTIYQENTSNNWYKWLGTDWTQVSGDPRSTTTTTTSTMPFYGVNAHYSQGQSEYTTNISQQVADMQYLGVKAIRQGCGNVAQVQALAALIPAFSPIVILPVFDQYPSISTTSETSTYNTYYTYGQQCATAVAGKVPWIEMPNEPENEYFPLLNNGGSGGNGQNITDWAFCNSIWPAYRGAMRGFVDGFRNIDPNKTTLIVSPAMSWLHYGVLDGLWNGKGPDGSTGNPTCRWDITNHHWYQDFGDFENAGNTNTNVPQTLKNMFGLPIALTEMGVQQSNTPESTYLSYITSITSWASTNKAKYGLVHFNWYELYNEQSGYGMGLFSAQGTANGSRASNMKSVIAANPQA